MPEEKIFQADELHRFTTEALQRVGVPVEQAQTIANVLVETDLRGVSTHGMAMLSLYIRRLQKRTINPEPNIRAVRDGPFHTLFFCYTNQ